LNLLVLNNKINIQKQMTDLHDNDDYINNYDYDIHDTLYIGNAVDVLKRFPPDTIDMVLTSPPYDGLRTYNGYSFPFEDIAKELFRVVKKGGVVVWVVGDACTNGSESGTSFKQALYFMSLGFYLHDTMIYEKNGCSFPASRTSNRYSQIFEYMFVFSKKSKPKTAHLICDKQNRWAGYTSFGESSYRDKKGELIKRVMKPVPEMSPRNNIWKYNTGKNYSTKDVEAFEHPAIFPEQLAYDHILTWSNEYDIVLDTFCGSGTTCKMAAMLNRYYIGIDISEEYINITEKRLDKLEEV